MPITTRSRDVDLGEWVYRQTFLVDSPGAIVTETTVSVSQDRAVAYLPMHMLIAGGESFGPRKHQGLFAGLEYLEDEPSSSEADIIGPEARRRVPASHKITFPLMAIQESNRYVGVIWETFDPEIRRRGPGGNTVVVTRSVPARWGSFQSARPLRFMQILWADVRR